MELIKFSRPAWATRHLRASMLSCFSSMRLGEVVLAVNWPMVLCDDVDSRRWPVVDDASDKDDLLRSS